MRRGKPSEAKYLTVGDATQPSFAVSPPMPSAACHERSLLMSSTEASESAINRRPSARVFELYGMAPSRWRTHESRSVNFRGVHGGSKISILAGITAFVQPPGPYLATGDSRISSTLPLHVRSSSRSCASLRSLWSAHGNTSTSKITPTLAHKSSPGLKTGDSCGAQTRQ